MSAATTVDRPLEGVYSAPPLHWVGDGFRVAGYFSRIPQAVRKLDPFLMLDYHPRFEYPPAEKPRGVGVHPHRGFETVTIAWQGSVEHHDSTGAGGVIRPGDVQWMTAASGILHKEHHEAEQARRGGPFQMAQLWVNLPRKHKLDPPGYQGLVADQMGRVELADGAVRVIAGEFGGVRGPARTFTPVEVLDVVLRKNGAVDLDFPATHNLAVLVMDGEVALNDRAVRKHDFAVFSPGGERVRVAATSEAQLLVLGGEPIGEPVVQYGPFAMTSEAEIRQAIVDFNQGMFGTLD